MSDDYEPPPPDWEKVTPELVEEMVEAAKAEARRVTRGICSEYGIVATDEQIEQKLESVFLQIERSALPIRMKFAH